MKQIALFIWNFALFFSVVSIMSMGAVAFVYLAICFVTWNMLGVEHLAANSLVALRITAVIAFIITTKWIFTDGRREWDYR